MKVLIEGEEGTPFENGVFLLDIVHPANYPFRPPKIRFETPIQHCNVNTNGGICLDVLKNKWSPALSLFKCLLVVREMMANPNTDDSLRPSLAELYFAYRQSEGTDKRYIELVRCATEKDASRTVDEWNELWGARSTPLKQKTETKDG